MSIIICIFASKLKIFGLMNLKIRLSVLTFLEFGVWGAYLTCMGNYLGVAGMGAEISWFYAIQGIVSIFMPTLIGIVADKWIQPQRLLGFCHLLAGVFMLSLWAIGLKAGFGNVVSDKTLFMTLYTLSVAFYMPTLALCNTTAFTVLKNNGGDTVVDFPPIRSCGTVGFIIVMWFVNCATWDNNGTFTMTLAQNAHKFQYTYNQFLVSGLLSLIMFMYVFTLPECKIARHGCNEKKSLTQLLGLDAFGLFKNRRMALFFIFSALLGMSLQVTNSFAGPFISSFQGSDNPAIASSFAASNATFLTSISQVSEAFCILLIPFFLKRYGIKSVMLIAMFAWVGRFGFFGVGNPTMPGVLFFILSCVVYGVAFDFFNVSGGIFVDRECNPSIKASAQGLFMLMTNGIGATVGTLSAGAIVNHFCTWTQRGETSFLMGDWQTCWFIFAGFALAVGIAFALVFKPIKQSH